MRGVAGAGGVSGDRQIYACGVDGWRVIGGNDRRVPREDTSDGGPWRRILALAVVLGGGYGAKLVEFDGGVCFSMVFERSLQRSIPGKDG